MGICRIQKPIGSSKAGISSHGDALIKITHNGIEGDEVKYEGEKGDLHLNLICEEGDGIDVAGILADINEQLADLEVNSQYIEDNDIEVTTTG